MDQKISCYGLCQKLFCLCFFAKTFSVQLIHFEFTFVYGVGKCSNFILLYVVVQFSQHHLLKRLSEETLTFLKGDVDISVLKVGDFNNHI